MHAVGSLGPERQLTPELDDQALDHEMVWLVHGRVLSGQESRERPRGIAWRVES
jgi:hypothetical protein